MQQSFNPRPLIKYMEKLGVPYYFLDSTIFDVCAHALAVRMVVRTFITHLFFVGTGRGE